MKVIYIRHGETLENAKGVVMGQRQGRLSKRGIAQAERIAKKLRNIKIDAIYSSDLQRAYKTAQIIARLHTPALHVAKAKALRECYYGRLQGKHRKDYGGEEFRYRYFAGEFKKYGVEDPKKAYTRVSNFIKRIYEKHKNKDIAIVSHGSLFRIFAAVINGIKLESAVGIHAPENCEAIVFEIKKHGGKFHSKLVMNIRA
ncbi:MAG: histidine phosphatase family protein [Candidatus Micrarchaeia archaeon]